jgi:hypothetical protein
MDTQQSGYQQKALNKSNKPEGVYEHPRVGINEVKRKERDLVPRTANYSRFSVYFSEWCLCPGGAYAPSNTVATSSPKRHFIKENPKLRNDQK